jgi:hypothetical protein
MPGGLLQLVATGAQNQLFNGNPTFTFWRTMYKRYTNFATESVRLEFENTTLMFPLQGGPSTFRCKVKRVTDLLHDCYVCFNLPDIWSPLYSSTNSPINDAPGYEFQWIENIGYNAIDSAGIYINGVKIIEAPGEWFKLYSHLTYDATKRAMLDRMVGNLPEIYDPQNSYGRMFQYPHAVKVINSMATDIPVEPSIRGRQIVVPLNFWFCENAGFALPLIALQGGEVEIRISFRPVYQLFTIQDVKAVYDGGRVAGDSVNYNITTFLSPPNLNGLPTNTRITNWFPDPYIEANYVYLTDSERAQVSSADQSYLIREVRTVRKETQYGPCDIEIPMHNTVTRVVWVAQRSDRFANNDYDNYTNWQDRRRRPLSNLLGGYTNPYLQLTSGELVPQSRAQRDIVLESTILLDAKERLNTKNSQYFGLIQHCRHTSGDITPLPGVYMYSFSLNNDIVQPSGGINGSLFNKVILRSTLIQPVPIAVTNQTVLPTTVCVYKSTVFNPSPTPVPANLAVRTSDVITLITRGAENVIYDYTYVVTVYVESYNVMRIVSGLANLVFAS